MSRLVHTASQSQWGAPPLAQRDLTLGRGTARQRAWFLPMLVGVYVLLLVATGATQTSQNTSAPVFPAPGLMSRGGGSGTVLPDLFTGTMSHAIPIEVPPGRQGMDPGLALTYRSTQSNGWVGVGWDLEVGAIERSTQHSVNYTGDDYAFRMVGSTVDLVNVGSGEYRAKIEEAFTRLKKLTAADGRPFWEATDKTGTRYLFGQRLDSRQDHPADANLIFKWCLDRVEDPHGNFMTFSYVKDQGQIYLQRIDYTGHQIFRPTNTVQFLVEGRSDATTMYTTGFGVTTAYRLKTIDIFFSFR